MRLGLGLGIDRSSGIVFSPARISGLQVWLDASEITGLADGAAVSSWSDISGNGRHFTQGTAGFRPTFQSDAGSLLNGRPVVRFDGSDDFLSASFTSINQPLTVFAVASIGGSGDYHRVFDAFDTTRCLLGKQTADNVTIHAGTGAPTYGITVPTARRLWTCIFDGASSILRLDKSTVISGTDPGSGGLSNGMIVGAGQVLGTVQEWLAGDIAAILVYNSALSADNYGPVENYLATRYGL